MHPDDYEHHLERAKRMTTNNGVQDDPKDKIQYDGIPSDDHLEDVANASELPNIVLDFAESTLDDFMTGQDTTYTDDADDADDTDADADADADVVVDTAGPDDTGTVTVADPVLTTADSKTVMADGSELTSTYNQEIMDEIGSVFRGISGNEANPAGIELFAAFRNNEGGLDALQTDVRDAYADRRIERFVDTAYDTGLVDGSELTRKGDALAQFVDELEQYFAEIDQELAEITGSMGHHINGYDAVKGASLDVEMDEQYVGPRNDTYQEMTTTEKISSVLNPLTSYEGYDSNPLMSVMLELDGLDRDEITDEAGYGSRKSMLESLRSKKQQGYLTKESERYAATPITEQIRESVDRLYDAFETAHEHEKHEQQRIKRLQNSMLHRKNTYHGDDEYTGAKHIIHAAEALDDPSLADSVVNHDEFTLKERVMAHNLSDSYALEESQRYIGEE